MKAGIGNEICLRRKPEVGFGFYSQDYLTLDILIFFKLPSESLANFFAN